jgi:hypothetical protein
VIWATRSNRQTRATFLTLKVSSLQLFSMVPFTQRARYTRSEIVDAISPARRQRGHEKYPADAM